jgi:DNA-binding HxlR family transcriptional regulator
MDNEAKRDLPFLQLLKTVADEHRLTMLRLMNGQERNVGELAGLVELSEPTVSHHIRTLRDAGLLNLRMAGNQRFYRLNPKKLAQFKAMVATIEVMPEEQERAVSDNAWIDALDWDEEDKKVLRTYTKDGQITDLPTKDKKCVVIMRWLATKFQPDLRYTEKQVNAILTEFFADYASLRRMLVDFGFMRRERGGGDYWLAPENEGT